jgi:hypothetical protein
MRKRGLIVFPPTLSDPGDLAHSRTDTVLQLFRLNTLDNLVKEFFLIGYLAKFGTKIFRHEPVEITASLVDGHVVVLTSETFCDTLELHSYGFLDEYLQFAFGYKH